MTNKFMQMFFFFSYLSNFSRTNVFEDMNTRVIIRMDVPEDEINAKISEMLFDSPKEVECIKQPDGNWTLKATFSEEPEGGGSRDHD